MRRRCLTISLLLLVVSSAIAPLLALNADAQSTLLACCRRNGAHHCVMAGDPSAKADPQVRALQSRCPAFPKALHRTPRPYTGLAPAQSTAADSATSPAVPCRTEIVRHAPFSRSRQKRGPPSILLS